MSASNIQELSNWFSVLMFNLFTLVILSMLLERALFYIFDYSLWRERIKGKKIKAPISLLVAWLACYGKDFDVLEPVLDPGGGPSTLGILITALIAAGGSAASINLFQHVLKFGREARDQLKELNEVEHMKKLEIARKAAP